MEGKTVRHGKKNRAHGRPFGVHARHVHEMRVRQREREREHFAQLRKSFAQPQQRAWYWRVAALLVAVLTFGLVKTNG